VLERVHLVQYRLDLELHLALGLSRAGGEGGPRVMLKTGVSSISLLPAALHLRTPDPTSARIRKP
jgi:hypothetical protein